MDQYSLDLWGLFARHIKLLTAAEDAEDHVEIFDGQHFLGACREPGGTIVMDIFTEINSSVDEINPRMASAIIPAIRCGPRSCRARPIIQSVESPLAAGLSANASSSWAHRSIDRPLW